MHRALQFSFQSYPDELTTLLCQAWNSAVDDPFMFATGSHDGAVRIWTKPPDDDDDVDVALSIPRSASPFDMDRTDSPITEQDLESRSTLESSNTENGMLRERVVAFAAEPLREDAP